MTQAAPAEIDSHTGMSIIDRGVAAFLWVLMAAGALAMWIGVPAATLWLAGKLTSDHTLHIVISLFTVPLAIIVWARGLFWVNRLYLRVTLPALMRELDEADRDDEPYVVRGPLEGILVGALVFGLIAMVVWFFFFAERPPASLSTS